MYEISFKKKSRAEQIRPGLVKCTDRPLKNMINFIHVHVNNPN